MTKPTLQILLCVAFFIVPTAASAQIAEFRCAADPLDATAALQRIEWARRCGLLTNSGGPNSWFSSPREYRELNPNRSYSGILNDYNVNFTYTFCRYNSAPLVTEFQETSGATTGFWKWASATQRPRPIYPIFESTPNIGGGIQLIPLPALPGDCNLYQRNPTTGAFSPWAGNFYVVAYCVP